MTKPKPNRRRLHKPEPPAPEQAQEQAPEEPDDGPPWRLQIADDRGRMHAYVCEPFVADKGLELQGRLLWAMGSLVGAGAELVAGQTGAIPGSALSEAVSGACGRLLVEEGADLFVELLACTTRDGKPLGSLEAWRAAYTLNYGELYAAVGWVVAQNFEGLWRRLPFGVILAASIDSEVFKDGWRRYISGSPPTPEDASPSSRSPEDGDSTPPT